MPTEFAKKNDMGYNSLVCCPLLITEAADLMTLSLDNWMGSLCNGKIF